MKNSIIRLALPALLAAASTQAATYNLVTNFNASNNPSASSTFSYGAGATPGAFSLDTTISLDASCMGVSSACFNNGVAYPTGSYVSWNNTGSTFATLTIVQPTTDIRLDPTGSAGSIVRFTAPVTGIYNLSGNFDSNDSSHHATNVLIYVNLVQSFSNTLGCCGSAVDPFSLSNLSLTAGNTIDFIVTSAGGTDYLSTGLNGSITGPNASTGTPEPASFLLIAGALPVLALLRRR